MDVLINVFISVLLYMSIPVAIRYVVLRRPIKNKWVAVAILVPIFISFSVLINVQREDVLRTSSQQIGLPYESRSHMLGSPILYVAMIASYFILRRGRKETEEPDEAAVIREADSRAAEKARKRTAYPIPKATPLNLATVKQSKAELEKSVDRHVSEHKDRGIVDVQNVSHSGTIPKAEVKSVDKSLSSDEAFYEKAFNELESEDRKVGLWAKVFAEAQGNETLAKASYLKIRSGQLVNEHRQTLLEEERQRQEMGKIAAIERRRQEKITEIESARTFISPTLGAQFVLIPSGMFVMGSPASEQGHVNEETQHQVTISKFFYIQTTPVTQGQWKAVMGNNPSNFGSCGDDCPVEHVSWNDVQKFILRLNSIEGTDRYRYRLPTEAEWEYACRAGSTTTYCFGGDPNCLGEYAWYDDNSDIKTHPVGQKKPNAWGLYDMHGNVWEWVQDWDGDYAEGSVTDPTGPSEGSYRVNRGGSWANIVVHCRSADRDSVDPGDRFHSLGFRLARTGALSDSPSIDRSPLPPVP